LTNQQPRVLCICILMKNNAILVAEGKDPVKHETFYRPIGGKLAFGEHGYQAVAREVKEEIGADVKNVQFLGTIENLFTYQGKPGHEIVLVYDGEFADETLYEKTVIEGVENLPEEPPEGGAFKAVWKPIEYFQKRKARLYPEGLIEMIAKKRVS
jgi:8-oxo-dGTP pyrophosphatase MutT (NUDIX family)